MGHLSSGVARPAPTPTRHFVRLDQHRNADPYLPPSLPSPVAAASPSTHSFTAVNATVATWSFKTISADGPGPKDYADTLTVIQHAHRVASF